MRIDIHAHYWTDDCLDLLADLGKTDAGLCAASTRGDGQKLHARQRLIDRAGRTCRCFPPRRSCCLTLMDRVKAVAAARFVTGQYSALAGRRPGRFRPSPPPRCRTSPRVDYRTGTCLG
jgi:6-methylsalicylate decarboxylase